MVRIRVRAFPEQGFFRAHRYWPSTWVDDEVDEAVLAVLQGERHLAVEVVGRSADDDEDDAKGPPGPPPMPKASKDAVKPAAK